ncbi:MAG: O-antigen ligase family protein [Geminicoccaceae bacterium]
MESTFKALLFVAVGFMFLSSSTAAAFDFQEIRLFAFAVVFGTIALAAFACHPVIRLDALELPLILLWFLGMMAVFDLAGTFDPLDYKVALPVLAIAVAPNVRQVLVDTDLPRWIFRAFAAYTLGIITINAFASGPLAWMQMTGRVDLSGSVVSMASLGVITVLLALGEARQARGLRRFFLVSISLLAFLAMFAAATRTAIVTLGVTGLLLVIAGPNRSGKMRGLIVCLVAILGLFAAHTLFVSDVFYLRLIGDFSEDYSSGRWHSLVHWLEIAASGPFGQGIGSVREIMQGGRPDISGGKLLEWPHNEFVRFFVEGGVFGFAMISLLVLAMTGRAVRSARTACDERERIVILVLAADMIAQSLLQNHFNMVYHSSMTMLLLATLTVPEAQGSPAIDTADRLRFQEKNGRGGSACRTDRNLPSMT